MSTEFDMDPRAVSLREVDVHINAVLGGIHCAKVMVCAAPLRVVIV